LKRIEIVLVTVLLLAQLIHFILDRYLYSFFFNDAATTEIYTLSLHDALPISGGCADRWSRGSAGPTAGRSSRPRMERRRSAPRSDRKSTRLNSSHLVISYAVFCLKKKKNIEVTSAAIGRQC